MKTMQELIKECPEGPLSVFRSGGVSWVHAQNDPSKPERIPQREICVMKDTGEAGHENAAFIVKAVNCHDKLAEALKMFVAQYEGDGRDERELRPEMEKARKALSALDVAEESE